VTITRTFRSRLAAEAHRDEVVARYALPRHYSRADLDDGTLTEVGSGRHVDPADIVREPVPEIHVSPTGKTWAVESTESERADTAEASMLREHDLTTWARDESTAKVVTTPKTTERTR